MKVSDGIKLGVGWMLFKLLAGLAVLLLIVGAVVCNGVKENLATEAAARAAEDRRNNDPLYTFAASNGLLKPKRKAKHRRKPKTKPKPMKWSKKVAKWACPLLTSMAKFWLGFNHRYLHSF